MVPDIPGIATLATDAEQNVTVPKEQRRQGYPTAIGGPYRGPSVQRQRCPGHVGAAILPPRSPV